LRAPTRPFCASLGLEEPVLRIFLRDNFLAKLDGKPVGPPVRLTQRECWLCVVGRRRYSLGADRADVTDRCTVNHKQ
jgi:hypothetical protein